MKSCVGRAIVANGTSADAQLAIFHGARDKGAEHEEALTAVNEWLADATLEGGEPEQQLQLKKTPYLGAAGAGVFDHPDGPMLHAPQRAETTAAHLIEV
jgi:hypothetical protein